MSQGNERPKRSILFQLMFIISFVVLTTSVVFTYFLVRSHTDYALSVIDSKLLTAAELTQKRLGSDYHDRIVDETSISKEEFNKIVATNDDICRRLKLQYLWSVLLVDNRWVFTSATHSDLNDPNSACASFFETHRDPKSFALAISSNTQPSFSSFENEWGAGRMVLIPGKDDKGRTYLYGASVKTTELNALISRTIIGSLEIALVILCGASILAFMLARSFAAPIKKLTKASAKIAKGDFDITLESNGATELQSLANSFQQMQQGLKQNLALLQEKEENYRRLVETTNEGLWSMDKNHRTTFVNARMAQLLGREPTDILGKSIEDFMFPQDLPAHQKRMATRYPKEGGNFECRFLLPDGGEIWLFASTAVLLNANGEFHGLFGMFTDITERRRAEGSLRESEKRLADIIDFLPDATLAIDKNKRVIIWNRAIQQMTGVSAEEMLGKGDYAYTVPFYGEPRNQLMDLIFKDDKDLCAKYTNLRHEGDSIIAEVFCKALYKNKGAWLFLKASPLWDKEGNIVGAIEIIRDITERKLAEEEREGLQEKLIQSQKIESVGRLAGGIAHDFNNMLGVILGRVELALAKLDSKSQIYGDLEEIYKAAERSARLTRQLLGFARKQTISPKVLNLNEVVENLLQIMRRLIGEDIDLLWCPGSELHKVNIDPSQIDQILANLCVNARDAIGGVGKVTIETQNIYLDENYCRTHKEFSPGHFVTITVSDNGCGMDKETLTHIFEPFFTTKGVGEGTGLGLSMVYGAVRQNNGFINVYSEPLKGTTFRVYLPRYEAPKDQQQTESYETPIASKHENILLIEDEDAILTLAVKMLENLGYNVIAANSPSEGLRIASNYRGELNLLITDVVMPEMNGRELAKKLLSFYPQLKILFMSGYTANVIAHHGVLDKGVHFMQKPFSIKDLAIKVREALDRV